MYKRLLTLVGLIISPAIAVAAPLYDTFGPLDDATFGGSGIPNQEVAISSQFSNGTSLITIAMSASQRYGNPALSNDGAGTYFAGTGSNTGLVSPAKDIGALWNFNYYINIDSPLETLSDYQITLFYDFDPADNTGPTGLGTIDITQGIIDNGGTGLVSLVEGSQNLMFGFLATTFGAISAPGGVFDPNAIGEYNFGISVSQGGWGVESVRMDVQTVPVPAAVWLFGSALMGLVVIKRKK